MSIKTSLAALSCGLFCAPFARAQLSPPPAPPGNPTTVSKALLGKVLFWDEQLSSTGTVSCGTCHMPEAGGSDPRTASSFEASLHPGADGVLGTSDDVRGSRGVPSATADGLYVKTESFGLLEQVTGRRAPSAIGAGYSSHLFWDGRAAEVFRDPESGAVVLASGAALESQALGPIQSSVEMGHLGRTWPEVVARLQAARPLALSEQLPAALEQWIASRTYPELFREAFGDGALSAVRLAMAIASYERTLTPNRSPWDQVLAGTPIDQVLSEEERAGVLVFLDPNAGNCGACHSTGLGSVRFTDDLFHYIGGSPRDEDLGRFNVTGLERDRGAFRTPDLRNVLLRAPYMHDGSLATLGSVIEFYNRGGDFDAPNKHPAIRPLKLSVAQRRQLQAFLSRPLTDPRLAAGVFPFDRPSQYADSSHVPQHFGDPTAGSAGHSPQMVALEPPKLGSSDMTIALQEALGGSPAFLLLSTQETPGGVLRDGARLYPNLAGASVITVQATHGAGPGDGWASVLVRVPDELSFLGSSLVAQWVVLDPGATNGRLAASEGLRWTLY